MERRKSRRRAVGSFVFVPYSAHGHLNPLLPVITALVARGADVRVVIDRGFAAAIAETGARLVALPHDAKVFVPEGLSLGRGLRQVRRIRQRGQAARFFAAELGAASADLVVAEAHLGWADRVARGLGIPLVQFSTTYVTSDQVVRARARWPVPLGVIRRLHRPARRFHRHRGLVLVNAVPDLQPAGHTLAGRVRFAGPLSAFRTEADVDLPWERIRRGPTLLVSPGTVFARGPEFFLSVVRAFAGTEWTVVLATGHTEPARLGPLPPNVIARRSVPQLSVLRSAAVFLTHGGMNSALEAIQLGVPMIVAPRSGEQKTVAKLLVGLGAGVPLRTGDLRRLAETVAGDQRIRQVLAGLRTSFANPVDVAADLLYAQLSPAAGRAGRRTST